MYPAHTLHEHVSRQHVHRTTLKIHLFCIYLEYTKMNELRFEYLCLYYVCTWCIHVCTWYVIVCSVQYLKNVISFPAPGNFHCELACNPFMIGLDSAYRQESANWYIHCL